MHKEILHKIEFRCNNCDKLLGYVRTYIPENIGKQFGLEIKCSRCKTINIK